jgi:large subunit ribosomal protein L15
MNLSTLSRPHTYKYSRRVGRGGKRGKTSGRGGKGQTARAGNKRRPEWRDIIKKIPKRRGFGVNRSSTVRPRIAVAPLTLESLERNFNAGDTVTIKALIERGIVRRVSGRIPPMKVLSRGEITKKLSIVKGITLSEGAKEKITKAGGTVDVIEKK